ncbi:MAG: hypothetical protein ACOXZ9_04235 [Bacteroidales bacterium]|jgi:hypothetical protein
MDKKDLLLVTVIILAIGGFIWALNEKSKRQIAELELDKKNKDYLQLMSSYLKTIDDIPESLKTQLINLRKEYIGVDDAVAVRLQEVIELIQFGKRKIALEKLALVIENLLKEKYINEGIVKDRKSCPSLFKMLEKARDLKWITKHHFNFSLFLKDKRNEEAHELTPNISENEIIIAFFSGIEIIYQLKGIKRVA